MVMVAHARIIYHLFKIVWCSKHNARPRLLISVLGYFNLKVHFLPLRIDCVQFYLRMVATLLTCSARLYLIYF